MHIACAVDRINFSFNPGASLMVIRLPMTRFLMRLVASTAVSLGFFLSPATTLAQTAPIAPLAPDAKSGPIEPPTPSWQITLKPAVWAPSLAGDLQLPGGNGVAAVERFNITDIQPTALGRFEIRRGKLSIVGSGFGFTLDERTATDSNQSLGGLSFSTGQAVNAEFDLLSAEVTAGWRVWDRTLGPKKSDKKVTLNVDAFGGLRAYNLNTSFGMVGGAVRGSDNTFIEPIVGSRLTVNILENFGFFLTLDGGGMPIGNHTSTSFNIVTGIHWSPWRHVGFEFGWRQLSVDLQDGGGSNKTEFNGQLAGIIGSIVIQF